MAGQSYPDWRAVIVDDCSEDGTPDVIREVGSRLGLNCPCDYRPDKPKLDIIVNTDRKWEIANTLLALDTISDDEIVCRLDLDDYLCDLNALEIISKAYAMSNDIDVVYSKHRWFDDNGVSNFNISAELPAGADPYKHKWVTSHFKTFKKCLLNNVDEENYRGADGEYFRRIGDQTFMLPALKNAKRWIYIPLAFYAYRCSMEPETFQTEDAKFQASEAEFLRARGYVEKRK